MSGRPAEGAAVARCQAELLSMAHGRGYEAEGQHAGGGGARIEELEQEFRRGKLTLISVEAQRRFLEMCFRGEGGRYTGPTQDEQQALKQQCKALKSDVAEERQQHALLCRQLAEARRELAARQAAAEREAAELARLAEEEEDAAAQLAAHGTAASHSAQDGAAAAFARAAEDARRVAGVMERGLSDEVSKRRRLDEDEFAQMLKWHRKHAATRAELERLERRESEKVEALEHLALRETELGLPDIRFDAVAGTVTIGGPGRGRAPAGNGGLGGASVELRTVQVAYDSEGHLTRAEPHPSLGLWNEGAATVEDDDIARLLTKVRERLSTNDSRGGAVAAAGA